MTEKSVTLNSKPRNLFRYVLFSLLIICLLLLSYFWVAAVIAFLLVTEALLYSKTSITLKNNFLHIKRTLFIDITMEEFSIDLNEIQSTYYHVEKYDSSALWHRFFIEIFFPSGQSVLHISLSNGKKHAILLNAHPDEVAAFQAHLPDRVPNV